MPLGSVGVPLCMESGGFADQYDATVRVEETIGIKRDPDDVWEMVSDLANDPRWCRKVKSVEPSGTGRWLVRHRPVPLRPALELVVERLGAERPHSMRLREEDEVSVF